MDFDFLIPVSLFALIAAVVIVPQILKSRERARLHDTLRAAYEKGQPVPPELIEALQTDRVVATPTDRSQRDFRIGIVWMFVGLGFVGVGAAFYLMLYTHGGSVETFSTFAAIGAVPFFIGLAFLLLSFFGRGRTR
jgi:Domain of unknown function (DUF6249)